MSLSRNEFLQMIVDAHSHALDELGNMDFWVDQYYLWTHENVRDGRIHDTTAKVMIPYEASTKTPMFKFDLEFDNGQTFQFEQASDGLSDEQIAHFEDRFSSKLIAGVVTAHDGVMVNYWNDDIGIEQDGQPTEYEEWQDYMGGDDWDHGQYDQA